MTQLVLVNGIYLIFAIYYASFVISLPITEPPSNFPILDNAVNEILKLCPARLLVSLYKVPSFDSVDDFLQKVATVRGKLKKGGVVDVDAAARIVLHDWNEGKCYNQLCSFLCQFHL